MFLHFLQKKEHKQAFLELSHLVANADGFVSGNEIRYLKSIMDELNVEGDLVSISRKRSITEILGEIDDERSEGRLDRGLERLLQWRHRGDVHVAADGEARCGPEIGLGNLEHRRLIRHPRLPSSTAMRRDYA